MRFQNIGHESGISRLGLGNAPSGGATAFIRAALATASIIGLLVGGTGQSFGQCESQWSPGFHLPGMNGAVHAVTMFNDGSGEALYVGGGFSFADDVPARSLAKWDGASWSEVGGGASGEIYSLAVFDDGTGPALYVGGLFREAGGAAVTNVARWDGNTWLEVGSGTNGAVKVLATFNDGSGPMLYAGGEFTQAGGVAANRIARWNGSNWLPMGEGFSGEVLAICGLDQDVNGPTVYAGGSFIHSGSTAVMRIARWSGSEWMPLATGVSWQQSQGNTAQVNAIRSFDPDGAGGVSSKLHVGGSFNRAGSIYASNLASWDGSQWSAVGSGVAGKVHALEIVPSEATAMLYVGGSFATAGGLPSPNLVRWTGSAWLPFQPGPNGPIGALIASQGLTGDDGVFVAGTFHSAGDVPAKNIALRQDGKWSALGQGHGQSYDLTSFAVFDDHTGNGEELYAGRETTYVLGVSAVVKWNGERWMSVGEGIRGSVYGLTVFDDGNGPALYAGGSFYLDSQEWLGNVRLAKWDGAMWSSVGGYINEAIFVLATWDDGTGSSLYAGGIFYNVNGLPVVAIAEWNGQQWSSLGSGVDGPVYSITGFTTANGDSSLYVGGHFSTAGGMPMRGIARWNGTSWAAVGGGIDGIQYPLSPAVHTMVVNPFDEPPALYVAGRFDAAGAIRANNIAKWDGSQWSTFQDGVANATSPGRILSMAVLDDHSLVISGGFTHAGSLPALRVARWNGTAWLALGEGFPDGAAWALKQYDHDGDGPEPASLYAAGFFQTAGGLNSCRFARLQCIATPCGGDISPALGDGQVNSDDLLMLIGTWGPCSDPQNCAADLDDSGVVDVLDLLALINAWGPCS